MFLEGGLIFVVPFLPIDFLIAQKGMRSPNIGQHICGPDKESDKQSMINDISGKDTRYLDEY